MGWPVVRCLQGSLHNKDTKTKFWRWEPHCHKSRIPVFNIANYTNISVGLLAGGASWQAINHHVAQLLKQKADLCGSVQVLPPPPNKPKRQIWIISLTPYCSLGCIHTERTDEALSEAIVPEVTAWYTFICHWCCSHWQTYGNPFPLRFVPA